MRVCQTLPPLNSCHTVVGHHPQSYFKLYNTPFSLPCPGLLDTGQKAKHNRTQSDHLDDVCTGTSSAPTPPPPQKKKQYFNGSTKDIRSYRLIALAFSFLFFFFPYFNFWLVCYPTLFDSKNKARIYDMCQCFNSTTSFNRLVPFVLRRILRGLEKKGNNNV